MDLTKKSVSAEELHHLLWLWYQFGVRYEVADQQETVRS
jgi:hypothetical protein